MYLELIKKDRYGRWVAKVSINGLDVAGEMLKHGLAWYYKEYENISSYAQLEAGARLRRLGLWRDDRAVPPWEWRKMSKAERDLYRLDLGLRREAWPQLFIIGVRKKKC